MSRSSNILRSSSVDVKGKVSIKNSDSLHANIIDISAQLIERQENIEKKIEEAEAKYSKIIRETEEAKQKIIEEASQNAKKIERDAYETGHEQGLKNGYEDGYKEAYEINIEKARRESQEIIEKADETLLNAQKIVAQYIEDKRNEILNLSVTIAEHVLREKFDDEESMNSLLASIIKEYELNKSILIKVNPIYIDTLQSSVDDLKISVNLKDELFVVGDSSIDKGNAVIETDNGKLLVGIDSVLDRIKAELL